MDRGSVATHWATAVDCGAAAVVSVVVVVVATYLSCCYSTSCGDPPTVWFV